MVPEAILEKLEPMLSNGKNVLVPQDICTIYQKDIDFNKLVLHLKMLPDAIKAVMECRFVKLQKCRLYVMCSISTK